MEEDKLNISEGSKINLDVKTLISIVVGIVSMAGIWFTLTAEIAQLQLDVVRMQDAVQLNEEFRIKWPRGEISYLQKDVDYLRTVVKELEITQAKNQVDEIK